MSVTNFVPQEMRHFSQPIAEQIWRRKYQYRSDGFDIDHSIEGTWKRVASGLADCEQSHQKSGYREQFYDAMVGFKLVPAGRILAGSGTSRNVTLCNTFVMRTIDDSVEGIMDTVKEAALTMQMGGGIGFDFSTIRPKGTVVRGLDCPAAGPLAAMDICDAVCKMLVSGTGRGAMMATMRCDHPDIEDFVTSKMDRMRFRNFNLSIMVTDKFIDAVRKGDSWQLIWNGKVVKECSAGDLWHKIMHQTYTAAEPGVLFIDRINAANPLNYLDVIAATNSCAEQPLPPNGTCPLASINLARLVLRPFTDSAALDLETLDKLVQIGVRMLDNTIDVSRYALPAQREKALNQRRIGLGVTGVANALAMLGVRYGNQQAEVLLGGWMQRIQNGAYLASAFLAKERGAFPHYLATRHLDQPMFQKLNPGVQDAVRKHGLRNGTLTTIAPTGTTSMLAGNVSSGIEPIFSTSFLRTITRQDGTKSMERVTDYATWLFGQMRGQGANYPDALVTASELDPIDHVRMQAAGQKWVDSGISKTVNCPEMIPFVDFKDVYLAAYDAGCKGCTTYRPNAVTGSVLSS